MSERQRTWDVYEAVILLDGVLDFIERDVSRNVVISRVSSDLKQMARNEGEVIDRSYRNRNSVSSHFDAMMGAYTGIRHRNPSALFCKTVDIYRKDREHYETILEEAKAIINSKTDVWYCKNAFDQWLSGKLTRTEINGLITVYYDIEEYCMNKGAISASVFEITDSETLSRVENCFKDEDFQNRYNDEEKRMIEVAWQYYREFLISRNEKKDDGSEAPDSENAVCQLDFDNVPDLSKTMPLSATVFGKTRENFRAWGHLYVYLFSIFHSYNPAVFRTGMSFTHNGGRPDIVYRSLTKMKDEMTTPYSIDNTKFVLEIGLTPNEIVDRIKSLCRLTNIGYENVNIVYRGIRARKDFVISRSKPTRKHITPELERKIGAPAVPTKKPIKKPIVDKPIDEFMKNKYPGIYDDVFYALMESSASGSATPETIMDILDKKERDKDRDADIFEILNNVSWAVKSENGYRFLEYSENDETRKKPKRKKSAGPI